MINNPETTLYIDNHADFSNSAKNFISKNILQKIIWKRYAKLIKPYVRKFYGVLPSRVDFLKNIYKINKNKIELLLMGADDDEVNRSSVPATISENKSKYGLKDQDFIVTFGGKIDDAKIQVFNLIDYFNIHKSKNIKLIIFGPVIPKLKKRFFNSISDNSNIKYLGFLNVKESYHIFALSNLAVFPGRHSVYWEQVVGQSIPAIFKRWEGTTHLDYKGNCLFLENDTFDELSN